MDRNDLEYNKHTNEKETERILRRRDREKHLEELSELESQEVSCWSKIFGSSSTLVLQIATFHAFNIWVRWYTPSWIKSNPDYLKYIDIGQSVLFIIALLPLLYYLWKMSNTKEQIAKIKRKVRQLDRELSK